MIIFGMDPSLANTAIVAMSWPEQKIVGRLLIQTEPADKKKNVRVSSHTVARAREIYEGIHAFVNSHHNAFDSLILSGETPSGSKSSSAMKSYGISCAMIASFPGAFEVTPEEVKKAAVGTKTASKAEMIAWAMERHPECEWYYHGKNQTAGKNEHIADAIATIYAMMKLPQFIRIQNLL